MKTTALRTTFLLALAIAALQAPLSGAINQIRELIVSYRATIAAGATLKVEGTLDVTAAQGVLGIASGIAAVTHDSTLTGLGTPASPLSVSGSAGSSVSHDATLTGTGIATDPLGLARPLYAIFEIPLGIYSAVWTDFELKGSLNNFTGIAEQALVYFYGSAYGSGISTHGPIGTTVEVYYTDDLNGVDHASARKYRRQDRSQSIFQQKTGRVGGVLIVVAVDANIHEQNPNLAFVYQRVSAINMEECWVPILPRWSRQYPHIP